MNTLLLCFLLVLPSAALLLTVEDLDYLKYFVRTIGSLDPNVSAVSYFNGTIFGKQPGRPLHHLFLFEGYNINRKLSKPDGTYLSLSREFAVYRHPATAEILRVWINPWTSKANEVFWVANDPVDATLGPSAAEGYKKVSDETVAFNTDVILEYPNPLSPADYSKYSAGQIYDAAELFTFFSNFTELQDNTHPSVPMTATWVRKSQYLPWMEMGTTPGCLYYTAMSWKCNEGINCVSDDIMKIIKVHYPEYQSAPTVEEDPNETSWRAFKKTIDKRRTADQPDIIIPTVNTTANVSVKTYSVDDRVFNILWNTTFLHVRIDGQAYSEVYGKQSYQLFNYNGFVGIDFEPRPRRDGYRIQLDGSLVLRDANGTELKFWRNPITGRDCLVSNPFKVAIDLVFKNDQLYTIDMPSSRAVGLVGVQSSDDEPVNRTGSHSATVLNEPVNRIGNHSVNFLNLVFGYDELAKAAVNPSSAHFYGTVSTFSNWLNWMDMDAIPGTLVTKATIYK